MASSGSFRTLYPGLGFFGASDALKLRVPVRAKIFGVRLSLRSAQPTFLNLQGLEFHRLGQRLGPDALPAYLETLSTLYSGSAQPELLRGRGVHSASETNPFWQATFACGVEVDELRVANRRDTWARRARSLRVEIRDSDGDWHLLYVGADEVAAQKVTDSLRDVFGIHVDDVGDTTAKRLAVLRSLSPRLAKLPPMQLAGLDWPSLLALVDLWKSAPFSDDELTLIAAFLFAQLKNGDDYSFTYVSGPLYSAVEIERMADRINELFVQQGCPSFMFTRHGLQKQGKLVARRDAYLEATNKVIAALEPHGLEPMVAYGTLLGAVRDRGFIPHDDDLDLLCRVDAHDFESARGAMQSICILLEKAGFSAKFAADILLNVHVQDSSGALIDVFPYWVDHSGAHLYMERMVIRTISEALLTPRSNVEMYGRMLPAPADCEAFLVERYGDTWHIRMPYFEWPWPLKDAANGPLEQVRQGSPMNNKSVTPSAETIMQNLPVVEVPTLMVEGDYYSYKFVSLHKAMECVSSEGDFAQFGVYRGQLARYLMNYVRGGRKLHLFDSFEGLPEDWVGSWKAGAFRLDPTDIPTFDPQIAVVHKGWFSDTVRPYMETRTRDLSFVHIDCDLYSSTKDALFGVNDAIRPGTIIVFDEYMMSSGGQIDEGEHRALIEWRRECRREFQYLWRTKWMQVAIRVLS